MLLGRKSLQGGRREPAVAAPGRAKVAIRTFCRRCAVRRSDASPDPAAGNPARAARSFQGIAEQTTRSLTESLKAIEASAKSKVSQQEKRARVGVPTQVPHRRRLLGEQGPKAGGDKVSGTGWRGQRQGTRQEEQHRHVACNSPDSSTTPSKCTGARNAPPIALADVEQCARRLREPAAHRLAGALKAGKSTLLNALIGEELAPTAATRYTTVVTWFRHGTTPSVQACPCQQISAAVPIGRRDTSELRSRPARSGWARSSRKLPGRHRN